VLRAVVAAARGVTLVPSGVVAAAGTWS
jgi:hypothetical protein